MYLQDVGVAIRRARLAKKLSQAALARLANVSRGTINQLEAGVYPDLGIKKLLVILGILELDFFIRKASKPKPTEPDYLKLACISANVSYKEAITPDVLAQTLLTGKVPPKLGPNLRVVYDELPLRVFDGMIRQVSRWGSKPERLARHVREIGEAIGCTRKPAI